MRKDLVFLLALALCAPLRAGTVEAPARAELRAWAPVIGPSLNRLAAAGTLDVGSLASLDYGQTQNLAALAPLTAKFSQSMTPSFLGALDHYVQDLTVQRAFAAARKAADARGAAFLAESAKARPDGGFEALERNVDEFLLGEHNYYLSIDLFRTLMDARPAIQEAAERERAERVNERALAIRQQLELDQRFDPELSLADEGPVSAVIAAHRPGLAAAAMGGPSGTFWVRADDAFEDLKGRFDQDGLALIARHPLGPWARAKLSSYRAQADRLQAVVATLKADHGVAARWRTETIDIHPVVTRTIAVPVSDSWARDWLVGVLDGVREGREGKERRREKAARKAAQKLETSLQKRDPIGAAAPLSSVVAYLETKLREAERNPDPGQLREVLAELRGEPAEVPPAFGSPYRTAALVLREQGASAGPASLAAVQQGWITIPSLPLVPLFAAAALVAAILAGVTVWAALGTHSVLITLVFLVPLIQLVRKYAPLGNALRLARSLDRRIPALLAKVSGEKLLPPGKT
jgi:hypothetical protein